jgi:mono/diheme cytochrome c family protein
MPQAPLQPALMALFFLANAVPAVAAPPNASQGRLVYEKANCVGCHKWHGDGGGGYGGAALSLRTTQLTRDELLEVVRCGRPGTGMPYHDREAYKTYPCFGGMDVKDMGGDAPRTPAKYLRSEEMNAVVDYVVTTLQGKPAATKDDCVAYWGPTSHECKAMK